MSVKLWERAHWIAPNVNIISEMIIANFLPNTSEIVHKRGWMRVEASRNDVPHQNALSEDPFRS